MLTLDNNTGEWNQMKQQFELGGKLDILAVNIIHLVLEVCHA